MNAVPLDLVDLALAAMLILVNGVLSVWLRLNLERQLLIATVRMVAQLWLLGLVLKVLFESVSPGLTALAATVMVLFAGWEVLARQERTFTGLWTYGMGTGAILLASTVVTLFALTTQVQPDPWYHPRYAIPLLGMILGNTMTGIALGFSALTTGMVRERAGIDARLALGDPVRDAFRPVAREAVRTGMIPIITSMAATGLVSLPGMMTGQILAGADPVEAIKYQLLIMFLIAGGTALGVTIAVQAGAMRMTDRRQRLRPDRLRSG